MQETGVFQLVAFILRHCSSAVFVITVLSPKQQWTDGRRNQNSDSINLSASTFYMFSDKCTSTSPLLTG